MSELLGGARPLTIHALSQAVSRISHAAGTEGNVQVVMREPVATAAGIRLVPCLTGNALRHRMLRAPAAEFVRQTVLDGLPGTNALVNFLFHGGTLKDASGRESLADAHTALHALPHLGLLGGCLPGQTLTGRLAVNHGMLVCRENVPRIEPLLPPEFPRLAALRPAIATVDTWQYVRGDAANTRPELLEPTTSELESQMIFSGQCVIAGACFWHGFTIDRATEVDVGCLLHSLALWAEAGGTIGGQSARGHGRLRTWLLVPTEIDQAACVAAFLVRSAEQAPAARELLARLFGVRAAAAAKKPAAQPAPRKKEPSRAAAARRR